MEDDQQANGNSVEETPGSLRQLCSNSAVDIATDKLSAEDKYNIASTMYRRLVWNDERCVMHTMVKLAKTLSVDVGFSGPAPWSRLHLEV